MMSLMSRACSILMYSQRQALRLSTAAMYMSGRWSVTVYF